MSESLRPEPLDPLDDTGVDADAKTEDLLLTGLDRYFAGEYQHAINVWTRVLFLDRGHARARAYIERARSALAEQQRESEELLDSGVAAFKRGETVLARRLLTSSLDSGAPQEVVLPILARLNRLEAAVTAVESARPPVPSPVVRPIAVEPPRRSAAPVWTAALLVLVAGVTFAALSANLGLLMPSLDSATAAVPAPQTPVEPLPMARPAEMALARATDLVDAGRLREALRALTIIRSTDPLRSEADRLQAEIQRTLLASLARAPAASPPAAVPGSDGTAAE